MSKIFNRTEKQKQQTTMLSGPHRHAMSYGGSRSGKTFGICRAMIIRAMKCKSRHAALRFKFNHAKTSLWYETFPKVFDVCFPGLKVNANKSDWFYQLPNGSEIWIGGLDEKERVEKILGKEYSTLFFNECSQLPYGSVQIALTRLAEQNILKKRAWYDENPPTKRHWSYPLFIKGLDPDTWEPRKDADQFTSMLMNPADNLDNIDSDYVSGVLDNLSERDRKRFRDGEFGEDASGNIYHAFDRNIHVTSFERANVPLILGMDFNVNPLTYTICQIVEDELWVLDEGYLQNSHTAAAAEDIIKRYPGRWTIIPDSTGKARKTSASGKTDHQILRDAGFNVPFVQNPFRMDRYNEVNALLEKKRLKIHPRCVKTIRDLEQVSYAEGSNLPDEKDPMLVHISDALGYLVHYAFPLVKIESGVYMVNR
jgi:PBSX family phage terminase large subunit